MPVCLERLMANGSLVLQCEQAVEKRRRRWHYPNPFNQPTTKLGGHVHEPPKTKPTHARLTQLFIYLKTDNPLTKGKT